MENFERFKKIVIDILEVDEELVTPDATIQSLGADSLDLVDIVMGVEDEFNITVEDNELENIRTVQDMLDYIAKK